MIKFNLYETFELREIASFERAKKGIVYPRGSTLIQISATKGEVLFLRERSEVNPMYVVVEPIAGVNHRYLNIVIEGAMDEFTSIYQNGLNIKVDDIGKMEVFLHDKDTQKAVVQIIEHIEKNIGICNEELTTYKTFKNTMIEKMLV